MVLVTIETIIPAKRCLANSFAPILRSISLLLRYTVEPLILANVLLTLTGMLILTPIPVGFQALELASCLAVTYVCSQTPQYC